MLLSFALLTSKNLDQNIHVIMNNYAFIKVKWDFLVG